MYTGAAQADVTTAAVNIIIMSHTTYLLYSLMCITLMVASHLFLVNIHEPGMVKMIDCIFVLHDCSS